MLKIKICGLCRETDVDYVNEALPDYAGFVFCKKSKRYISEKKAAGFRSRLDAGIKAVGVFVDEDPERIVRLLKQGTIDIAQLHGRETEKEIVYIKEASQKPVFKAVVVRRAQDVADWQSSAADELLFDGGRGEGKSFSLKYARDVKRPFFLAGGMNAERIRELQSLAALPALTGIDISSGVETDGAKDRDKILLAVQMVREWEAEKGKGCGKHGE